MKIIASVNDYLNIRNTFEDLSLGFVPTMGALHAGHESLVERSIEQCDVTVVSIYVNPTQFNNADDLKNYPDTLTADVQTLESLGVDYLFLPSYDEIYPDKFRYKVEESEIARHLCGAHRDGHFEGVLTVVMKLLNIVRPAVAFFGEKDYQQYLLIKGMAEAFFMDVDIVSCPTVRERDGLALSSRNKNLTQCSRTKAPLIHQLISSSQSDGQITDILNDEGFEVDYVQTRNGRRFVAAMLGEKGEQVRLIDNVYLGSDQQP
ncbi:MAG: pantoate--beta-alanine ligase [Pseudomonadales bacterium]|jgi:pantoate--beta-alanine ligase